MNYIDKIVESNNKEKMEQLKEVLVDAIDYLKSTDHTKYKSIEFRLYEIVEGKKLNEQKAKEWVESMKPAYKWTMQDTNQVRESYKVEIPAIDFYALMNMLYTDYSNVIEDAETYVKLAQDWYYDEDSSKQGSEKLYCYWKMIKD